MNHHLLAKNTLTPFHAKPEHAEIMSFNFKSFNLSSAIILLAIKAGATDIIIEQGQVHYKLNGVRTTIYEAGYYYESLELSDN